MYFYLSSFLLLFWLVWFCYFQFNLINHLHFPSRFDLSILALSLFVMLFIYPISPFHFYVSYFELPFESVSFKLCTIDFIFCLCCQFICWFLFILDFVSISCYRVYFQLLSLSICVILIFGICNSILIF